MKFNPQKGKFQAIYLFIALQVESGSGGSSSSVKGEAALLRCREDIQEAAAEAERERREHERLFKGLRDASDDLKGETSLLPLPPGMSGKDIAGYVPNQRLEWKRYKQYTRNDIMAAIEEVKKGENRIIDGIIHGRAK